MSWLGPSENTLFADFQTRRRPIVSALSAAMATPDRLMIAISAVTRPCSPPSTRSPQLGHILGAPPLPWSSTIAPVSGRGQFRPIPEAQYLTQPPTPFSTNRRIASDREGFGSGWRSIQASIFASSSGGMRTALAGWTPVRGRPRGLFCSTAIDSPLIFSITEIPTTNHLSEGDPWLPASIKSRAASC